MAQQENSLKSSVKQQFLSYDSNVFIEQNYNLRHPLRCSQAKQTQQTGCTHPQGQKAALGLPAYISNKKLLELGLHNTLSELIEAQ